MQVLAAGLEVAVRLDYAAGLNNGLPLLGAHQWQSGIQILVKCLKTAQLPKTIWQMTIKIITVGHLSDSAELVRWEQNITQHEVFVKIKI